MVLMLTVGLLTGLLFGLFGLFMVSLLVVFVLLCYDDYLLIVLVICWI